MGEQEEQEGQAVCRPQAQEQAPLEGQVALGCSTAQLVAPVQPCSLLEGEHSLEQHQG